MPITKEIDLLVQQTAKKYGVPVNLVRAVIGKESGQLQSKGTPAENYWSADHGVRSPVGAIGLMQLMPATAQGLGVDPTDVGQNIEGGVKYLKQQLDAFGGDQTKALAAYNAGPGNVRKHKGVPPFRETQNYVQKINSWLPALDTAFAGDDPIPSTTGVPSVAGTGTGAASAASAMGVAGDEATAIQERYSAIGDAYKQSAEQQKAYANRIADMAGAAPDLAASVSESLASSNAALANFSAGSRATVDRTFAELEQKDIARRAILQGMLTDKNLDPTVAGSIADMSTDNMAMLNRRMNATILAEQATNEMSVADNPAGFFEKMLFGNLYTQGRQELRSQFDELQAVTDGTISTVNAQYKQAADAKIGDPALDKMKMDATLKLAEIDKDVAIQQAQAPMKVAEAQIESMRVQAQMMGYSVDAMKGATQSEVQGYSANIDAAKAPLDATIRNAQATSAQNAAASGSMDVSMQRQFYAAKAELMEIELNGTTAEAKVKAREARAALDAFNVLDASGAIDRAAFERAMTAANKAKTDYLGTTAQVGTNAAVKEVEARNAQFQQTIDAKPNPEYAAVKEASDMATWKANIAQIEKDKGSEAAIQAGFVALGLPPTADVSKYPPDVQNAIKAAGQGQKGGVNPVAAAQAFVTGGVSSSSPELAKTAQAVLNAGKVDTEGKVIPFHTLKPEEKEALSATEIQAAVNLFEGNKGVQTPIFSDQYIYGMLPPAVLSSSPHTTASQKKSLETFTATVVKNGAAATSAQAMILALTNDGVAPKEIARIVSDVAAASIQHNNATRKYNLLGLENQSDVLVTYDPIGPNMGRKTGLNLADMADVQLLVMDTRIKAMGGYMGNFSGALGNPVGAAVDSYTK